MKLKIGDKVRVMVGKDKGKEGTITHTFKNENKVVIGGLNMIKKHMKPNNSNESGGIIDREAKINASNVMLIDSKTNKVTRKVVKNVKKEEKKKVEPKKTKSTRKTKTSTKED